MYSIINESCVIKTNSDYQVDPIEHHLKDVVILNRENELSLRCGRNIDASLTSIDIVNVIPQITGECSSVLEAVCLIVFITVVMKSD